MSVNKAILVGRVGKDVDSRRTNSGQSVAKFSLATNERWTDKSGNKQERTEWHNIIVWGKLAEVCENYLKKGHMVYLEGRIQTREYDDRDGNKRRITEIVVKDLRMLGGGGQERGDAAEDDSQPAREGRGLREPTDRLPEETEGSDVPF